MREEGYYKVKYKGAWEVAELCGTMFWFRIGIDEGFEDSDFEEIGDKITF